MPTLSSVVALSSLLVAAPTITKAPRPVPTNVLFGMDIPVTPVPAGFARYCSLTYPSGGWAFDWDGGDPCGRMLASSPGGTIARAGLYSTDAGNNVVVRCGGGIGLYRETGAKALRDAFNQNKDKQGCVVTVAPQALPIFNRPHAADESKMGGANWFDFSRGYSVESNSGTTPACVNGKGESCNYDGHEAYDWSMPEGTTIKAAAAGKVLVARSRDVQSYLDGGCAGNPASANSSQFQQEMYVVHKVGTGVYAEFFVSYYAHFSEMSQVTGATVARGDELGEAGSTGCSTGNHLHFEVTRFTNTATKYRRSFAVPPTEDYDRESMIDPYGFSWSAKVGFDPWAWRAFATGDGALSINLWRSGQQPKR